MEDSAAVAKRLLEGARTIAVLGAHPTKWRPAFYVPDYLQQQGYRVLPVNPRFAGKEILGEPVVATLDELKVGVDFVDVFRRAEWLPAHIDEILAMSPRPPAVWLQQGIRNDEFAAALRAEGIEVVQDRCTLADHKRMGLPALG